MSQQSPPIPQPEFHGVFLAGNPVKRPRGSASRCENVRVMPGYYLRLAGGRKGRWNLATENILQIHPYRVRDLPGVDNFLVQKKAADNSLTWAVTSILTCQPDPTGTYSVPIATANDSAWCRTHAAAVCNNIDSPIMYNGLGTRDANGSKPALSTMRGGTVPRYFGLDCYAPGGNPTVAWVAGSGNNAVSKSVDIWVGVYDSATDHYSNGIYCGTITTNAGPGTIRVSNLDRILVAWANNGQRDEYKWCFYATIDGYTVPYQILAADLLGPYTVAITSTTADLSISSGTLNGWVLNVTGRVPQGNHPPRPMKSICYANGRLYGIPLAGGTGSPVPQRSPSSTIGRPDFQYPWSQPREYAQVVWSAAWGDASRGDALGDPLQCWPLQNAMDVPNGDQPICVAASPDSLKCLVFTPRCVFVLAEAADGLHEPDTITEIHGISRAETLVATDHGLVWVNQRNQIVMLSANGMAVLSAPYQELMASPARCADYLLDPLNEIDQYRVWLENGTCVIHDFAVGEAYTATGQAYTAARTINDATGKRWHLVANTAIYTQEGQPDASGAIKTGIETFTSGQTVVTTYPTGVWERNWDDQDDSNQRKKLEKIAILGDGAGVELDWRGDFQEAVAQNYARCAKQKSTQSRSDAAWEYKPSGADRFWHKLKFTLTATGVIPTHHPTVGTQGDLARNFFGSILGLLFTWNRSGENRG